MLFGNGFGLVQQNAAQSGAATQQQPTITLQVIIAIRFNKNRFHDFNYY